MKGDSIGRKKEKDKTTNGSEWIRKRKTKKPQPRDKSEINQKSVTNKNIYKNTHI